MPTLCDNEADIVTFLRRGGADAVVMVLCEGGIKETRLLSELRRHAPATPLIVLLPDDRMVDDTPPVVSAGATIALPLSTPTSVLRVVLQRRPAHRTNTPRVSENPAQAPALPTEVLRSFSQLLGHTLEPEAFASQFADRLRSLLDVTHVALFLAPPVVELGFTAQSGEKSESLFCIAASGYQAEIARTLSLSLHSGIGRDLAAHPGVMINVDRAQHPETQGEFEMLGAVLALPLLNQDGLLGSLIVGPSTKGDALSAESVSLGLHLAEQFAHALRNGRLHHQIRAQHLVLSKILAASPAGAVVFSKQHRVLFANASFARLSARDISGVDFSLLPTAIAQAVHQTLEHNQEFPAFETTYFERPVKVSVVPLAVGAEVTPAALVLLEDLTLAHELARAAAAQASTEMLRNVAERFAHESRNAITSISTFGQLIDENFEDPAFREQLKSTLHVQSHRIDRFTQQLLLLASEAEQGMEPENVSWDELLRTAVETAENVTERKLSLDVTAPHPLPTLRVPREAVTHALTEIFINSIQFSPDPVTVHLQAELKQDPQNPSALRLSLRDSGPGFTAETAKVATDPFYTGVASNVGLGLTVTAAVLRQQGGQLHIHPRDPEGSGPDLEISLPLS